MSDEILLSPTFTDSKNQSWTMSLTAPLVRKIQQATSINLTDLKSDPFEKLALDPLKLADVIWMLCETQATSAGLDAEQFLTQIAPHIDDAVAALEAAVTNFFPASKKSLLLSLRSQNATMTQNATTKAMEALATNQSQIEAAMAKRMQKELTSLLESFDSADLPESKSVT
jgi:hypothetical protein